MKDTKRRFETFSFYDHSGIEAHLEKMAAEGWLLERISNFGWVYRRIEPKKLCFTITHYPKATEFDPEMSEEQKILHDFCEHSGWILAATAASMQVFYNEEENPVPIETDPQIEVENVHAAMKKNYLPSFYILSGLGVLQGALFCWRLLIDPIGVLASVSGLYTGLCWALLTVLCAVEIGGYFCWYRKAKVAAERGEFLETRGNRILQKIVLAVAIGGAAYWLLTLGSSLEQIIGIVGILYVFAVMVIVNGVKNFMKRKKVKAGTNKTITWITSFVASFAIMGVLSFFLMRAIMSGAYAKAENPKVETYEHHGVTIEVYHDELPLEIGDLLETNYEKYSTRWRAEESPLLTQIEATQTPHFDDLAAQPSIEYTITKVKLPALYDWCFAEMYQKYEDNGSNAIRPEEDRLHYVAIDASQWNANAAYQVYSGSDPWNRYLICWDDCIVELRPDWELSEEQKQVVAEKLEQF